MGDLLTWFVRQIVSQAYGGGMLEAMGDNIEKIEMALDSALTGTGASSLASAYEPFRVAALGILVIYFLMDIVNIVNGRRGLDGVSPDAVVMSFTRLLIGYIMINNGLLICRMLMAIMSALLGVFRQNGAYVIQGYSQEDLETMFLAIKTYASLKTFLGATFGVLSFILPYFIMWVVRCGALLAILESIFSLLGMAIVSPIAFARSFTVGQASRGWNYVRKMLSLALRAAAVIAIIWAGCQLTAGIDAQGGTAVSGLHNAVVTANENAETIEEQSSQGVGGWLKKKAGGLVLTAGYLISGAVTGSDGKERYVQDVNDLFNVDYDPDSMSVLDETSRIGKDALDSVTDLPTIIFISAIQIGMLLAIISINPIIDAITGADGR